MKKVLLNCIPIILHLMFIPLWMDYNWLVTNGWWSLSEALFNILIVPIYLVIVNSRRYKVSLKNIIISNAYMVAIAFACPCLKFLKWWFAGGKITYEIHGSIDNMTIELIHCEMYIACIFVVFLWNTVNTIFFIKEKRNKE